jgi:outer membrane receptor protein involved in Fe transport
MRLSIVTRATLLAGLALFAAPASAQQDNAPTPGGEIVVTGSRIQRPDYAAPNPIVSFDAERIHQSGTTNVTSFLQRVPALTNSLDSTRTAGNAQGDGALGQIGLNLLDLRGLGPARTLVLVNGRRHVAGQADTAAVDINAIPTDLIERVDVLTGAASAVYGADGVSGVVNFILRRDFDGVAARGQAGASEEGDAANRFISLVVGRNFADGRANLTAAYEFDHGAPLANDDRSFLVGPNRFNFVNVNGYDPTRPGSYQSGPVSDLRYPDSSTYGIVDIAGVRYRGDGAIYNPGERLENDGYSTGGDDTPVAAYIGDILPRTKRHAVNLLGRFEASDAFVLSVEGKVVQTDVRTFAGYGGNYPATIALDNPFIPGTILAPARTEGLTAIDISRNNFDIPWRGEEDRRRTWRGVVDVTGAISEHASYDVSYTYGRTDLRATKLNDRLATQFAQALDAVRDPATGQIVCRSAAARAAGCVPVNTFGANTVDPQSFGYYLFDPVSAALIEQHVVNASLTGDFGRYFELPGGPVQFAISASGIRARSIARPIVAR